MSKVFGRQQVHDRDALHSYLFHHTNSRGVVRVNKKEFAEEVGCNARTLASLLRDLVLLEKIERVIGPTNHSYYYVTEPEKKVGQKPKKKERVVMWG